MFNKTLVMGIMAAWVVTGTVFAASIDYNWFANGNVLTDSSGNDIPAGDATVLTYLTSDETINFDPTMPFTESYSDDLWHNAQPNTFNGQYWTAGVAEDPSDYVDYYAYAVVLDLPYTNFVDVESISESTYCGISELGQESGNLGIPWALDDAPPAPAQSFVGGSVQTDIQVIPEPGALLLTGVLAMFTLLFNRSIRHNKCPS